MAMDAAKKHRMTKDQFYAFITTFADYCYTGTRKPAIPDRKYSNTPYRSVTPSIHAIGRNRHIEREDLPTAILPEKN